MAHAEKGAVSRRRLHHEKPNGRSLCIAMVVLCTFLLCAARASAQEFESIKQSHELGPTCTFYGFVWNRWFDQSKGAVMNVSWILSLPEGFETTRKIYNAQNGTFVDAADRPLAEITDSPPTCAQSACYYVYQSSKLMVRYQITPVVRDEYGNLIPVPCDLVEVENSECAGMGCSRQGNRIVCPCEPLHGTCEYSGDYYSMPPSHHHKWMVTIDGGSWPYSDPQFVSNDGHEAPGSTQGMYPVERKECQHNACYIFETMNDYREPGVFRYDFSLKVTGHRGKEAVIPCSPRNVVEDGCRAICLDQGKFWQGKLAFTEGDGRTGRGPACVCVKKDLDDYDVIGPPKEAGLVEDTPPPGTSGFRSGGWQDGPLPTDVGGSHGLGPSTVTGGRTVSEVAGRQELHYDWTRRVMNAMDGDFMVQLSGEPIAAYDEQGRPVQIDGDLFREWTDEDFVLEPAEVASAFVTSKAVHDFYDIGRADVALVSVDEDEALCHESGGEIVGCERTLYDVAFRQQCSVEGEEVPILDDDLRVHIVVDRHEGEGTGQLQKSLQPSGPRETAKPIGWFSKLFGRISNLSLGKRQDSAKVRTDSMRIVRNKGLGLYPVQVKDDVSVQPFAPQWSRMTEEVPQAKLVRTIAGLTGTLHRCDETSAESWSTEWMPRGCLDSGSTTDCIEESITQRLADEGHEAEEPTDRTDFVLVERVYLPWDEGAVRGAWLAFVEGPNGTERWLLGAANGEVLERFPLGASGKGGQGSEGETVVRDAHDTIPEGVNVLIGRWNQMGATHEAVASPLLMGKMRIDDSDNSTIDIVSLQCVEDNDGLVDEYGHTIPNDLPGLCREHKLDASGYRDTGVTSLEALAPHLQGDAREVAESIRIIEETKQNLERVLSFWGKVYGEKRSPLERTHGQLLWTQYGGPGQDDCFVIPCQKFYYTEDANAPHQQSYCWSSSWYKQILSSVLDPVAHEMGHLVYWHELGMNSGGRRHPEWAVLYGASRELEPSALSEAFADFSAALIADDPCMEGAIRGDCWRYLRKDPEKCPECVYSYTQYEKEGVTGVDKHHKLSTVFSSPLWAMRSILRKPLISANQSGFRGVDVADFMRRFLRAWMRNDTDILEAAVFLRQYGESEWPDFLVKSRKKILEEKFLEYDIDIQKHASEVELKAPRGKGGERKPAFKSHIKKHRRKGKKAEAIDPAGVRFHFALIDGQKNEVVYSTDVDGTDARVEWKEAEGSDEDMLAAEMTFRPDYGEIAGLADGLFTDYPYRWSLTVGDVVKAGYGSSIEQRDPHPEAASFTVEAPESWQLVQLERGEVAQDDGEEWITYRMREAKTFNVGGSQKRNFVFIDPRTYRRSGVAEASNPLASLRPRRAHFAVTDQRLMREFKVFTAPVDYDAVVGMGAEGLKGLDWRPAGLAFDLPLDQETAVRVEAVVGEPGAYTKVGDSSFAIEVTREARMKPLKGECRWGGGDRQYHREGDRSLDFTSFQLFVDGGTAEEFPQYRRVVPLIDDPRVVVRTSDDPNAPWAHYPPDHQCQHRHCLILWVGTEYTQPTEYDIPWGVRVEDDASFAVFECPPLTKSVEGCAKLCHDRLQGWDGGTNEQGCACVDCMDLCQGPGRSWHEKFEGDACRCESCHNICKECSSLDQTRHPGRQMCQQPGSKENMGWGGEMAGKACRCETCDSICKRRGKVHTVGYTRYPGMVESVCTCENKSREECANQAAQQCNCANDKGEWQSYCDRFPQCMEEKYTQCQAEGKQETTDAREGCMGDVEKYADETCVSVRCDANAYHNCQNEVKDICRVFNENSCGDCDSYGNCDAKACRDAFNRFYQLAVGIFWSGLGCAISGAP